MLAEDAVQRVDQIVRRGLRGRDIAGDQYRGDRERGEV